MKITIKIDTSNAAFEEYEYSGEVSFILEQAKRRICNQASGMLFDSNGNTCGTVTISGLKKGGKRN